MELIGLIMGMAGTALAFKFGFPQPDFEESVGLALEDNTPVSNGMTAKQFAEAQRRKRSKYKFMAYVALSLICLGFVMQVISTLSN